MYFSSFPCPTKRITGRLSNYSYDSSRKRSVSAPSSAISLKRSSAELKLTVLFALTCVAASVGTLLILWAARYHVQDKALNILIDKDILNYWRLTSFLALFFDTYLIIGRRSRPVSFVSLILLCSLAGQAWTVLSVGPLEIGERVIWENVDPVQVSFLMFFAIANIIFATALTIKDWEPKWMIEDLIGWMCLEPGDLPEMYSANELCSHQDQGRIPRFERFLLRTLRGWWAVPLGLAAVAAIFAWRESRYTFFFGYDPFLHMGYSRFFLRTGTINWTQTYTNPPLYPVLLALTSSALQIQVFDVYKYVNALVVPIIGLSTYFLAKEANLTHTSRLLATTFACISSGWFGKDWFGNFYVDFFEQRPEQLSLIFLALCITLYMTMERTKKLRWSLASGIMLTLTVLTSYISGLVGLAVVTAGFVSSKKTRTATVTFFLPIAAICGTYLLSDCERLLSMLTAMSTAKIFSPGVLGYYRYLGLPALLATFLIPSLSVAQQRNWRSPPIWMTWGIILIGATFLAPIYSDLAARAIVQAKIPTAIMAGRFLDALFARLMMFRRNSMTRMAAPFLLLFVVAVSTAQPLVAHLAYSPNDFPYVYASEPPVLALEWLRHQPIGVVAGAPSQVMFFVYGLTDHPILGFPGQVEPEKSNALFRIYSRMASGDVDIELQEKYDVEYVILDRVPEETKFSARRLATEKNLFIIGYEDNRTLILIYKGKQMTATEGHSVNNASIHWKWNSP